MAPDPHETSGSVSSDGSTTKLLSVGYSCSSLPAQTLTILSSNPRTSSVSSRMLFGDGEAEDVEHNNNTIQYDHNNDVENRRDSSVHSSEDHIYQDVAPMARSNHVVSTSAISSMYNSVRELIYAKLSRQKLPKSKQVPILLCLSVNVGLVALSLVAIFTTQYIKSIEYVYRYENCSLCADLTEDHTIFITYLRRQGDLKYCCFQTERDPVSRLNKAVMKTFDKTIKEKHLQRNTSIETNGTDAAMKITLEIGKVSAHFIPDNDSLPMRRLTLLTGNMKVENDRLVIQKAGRYFINSQFYHYIKLKKNELNLLEDVVGHDIHRFNKNLPNDKKDQLMVNFYTARDYLPKTDYHVSHIAGIFQLNEKDEIYVGATNGTDTSGNRLSLIFLGDQ